MTDRDPGESSIDERHLLRLKQFSSTSLGRLLIDRICVHPDALRPVLGRVKAVPPVFSDLDLLTGGGDGVPAPWRLSFGEAERVGDVTFSVMESLAGNPAAGEPVSYARNAPSLTLCRRLEFDPATTAPIGPSGMPWLRLCLYWVNQMGHESVKETRILAVMHRLDPRVTDWRRL